MFESRRPDHQRDGAATLEDMGSASDHLDQRRRTFDLVAARLNSVDDDGLAALLAETVASRANMHGNQSGVIDVDGAKVFVKKIALTDLERTPGNEGSTANLFDLPLLYHYGVGSAGFGAWRELDAYRKASAWALSGEWPHFPLVYHWRVLPRQVAPPSTERLARRKELVEYWGRSDAIRARLEAISSASASIVLFLEHVPKTLHEWRASRRTGRSTDAKLEAAILRLHDQWRDTALFMNARGMLHFDLNQYNLLTDGERLYAADFGLAICSDFDLSPLERAFFETHRLYDRCYAAWAFAGWLDPEEEQRAALTPALQALVDHSAPVAGIFRAFIEGLGKSKATPYPAAELRAAVAASAH